MSEIKGYVVRGKANDAPVFYVGDGDFVYAGVGDGETPKTLNTIGDSSYAVDSMDNGCTDVRIYAVAEDGAETPLPTYEEALTIVDLAGKERAAWARLVKAERRFHDQTDLLGERDDDAKGARTGVDDAAQALRDLGVDVDALLGDP